jgi:ribonuclease Z
VFELVFLGTSASAPSVHRGLSAAMVLHKEHRFLIDCGEGTQRQLLKSGLGFRRLAKILLTHGHLDHILGLGGLISTFSRWEAIDKLEIWGGRWTLDRVEDLIYRVVLRGARAPLKIEFYEIEPDVLMEGDTFTLRAFAVDHRGADCFGFTFEEKSRRPFLADKAEALGVPAGPERKRLVQGQAITLADGRLIQPDNVLGEWQPGAKLVFVSDAGRTDNLVDEAHGADMLVIEATYLHQEAGLAQEFGHLTARQAATLAHQAGAKQLVLTHLSRRNRERDTLAEAQAIFPNTVVARDFDHFRVVKEKQKRKEE